MKENKLFPFRQVSLHQFYLREFSLLRWNASLGLLGICVGLFCYFPQDPDSPRSVPAFLGLLGYFLAYLCAQISWGSIVCKAYRQMATLWESAFWGSLFFALVVGVFGFWPILGENFRPAWLLFLLVGLILSFLLSHKKSNNAPEAFHWADGVAIFYLLFSFAGALSPHSYWDSLWYHLTSSRLWFEAGKIHLPENFPIALKSGFWDYHFFYGQILLGSAKDAGGLIAAQIFGQLAALATVCFSYLTIRQGMKSFGFTPFMALLAILGTELFFEVEFAKNDWAGVFWTLVAVTFALQRRPFYWIALVAGFSFAAKFTSAFFFAPFLLYVVWQNRREPRALAFGFLLFFLSTLPLLVRNLAFTGNPFFPALHHQFPTTLLGPSWENIKAFSGNTFTLPHLIEKFLFLLRDSKAVIFLLAWALIWPLLVKLRMRSSMPRALLPPLLAALCSALLFLFGSGPKAEWRLLGASLPLLAAGSGFVLESFLKNFFQPKWVGALLTVLVLMLFPVTFSTGRLWQEPAELIRQWPSGAAMAWVRMNAKPEDQVATLQETRIYYLFPKFPLRVFDQPSLDTALTGAENPTEMAGTLKRAGIRYLILSAEFLDRYYNRRVCDAFYQLSESHPRMVVFRTEFSRVLDLNQIP
jgi:hypothetical protein